MLTYATLGQFRRNMVGDTDTVAPDAEYEIEEYLRAATRYIKRNARRDFLPHRASHLYPVPHEWIDLAVRRLGSADLFLHDDLLEVTEITNGSGDVITSSQYFLLDYNVYPKYAIALKFPAYWELSSGNLSSHRYDEPSIEVEAIWGYHDEYTRNAWIDTGKDVPAGDLTDSATEMTITGASTQKDEWGAYAFEKGILLKIDSEWIEIVDVDGTAVTIRRGVNGSTAAAHTAGASIYRWRVVEDIQIACLQIAKQTREHDKARGGRIGTGEVTASVELVIPKSAGETVQKYTRAVP